MPDISRISKRQKKPFGTDAFREPCLPAWGDPWWIGEAPVHPGQQLPFTTLIPRALTTTSRTWQDRIRESDGACRTLWRPGRGRAAERCTCPGLLAAADSERSSPGFRIRGRQMSSKHGPGSTMPSMIDAQSAASLCRSASEIAR